MSKIPFEVTPARMERGRYLTVSFCFHCHSERDETKPGSPVIEATKGAGRVVTDDGTNYLAAPNITPDKETGAGTWPDDALARSIREGVGHDGRALASPMRSQDYRGLSDEDVKAIVVYLRTLTPVKKKLPARKLSNATGKAAVRKAAPLTSPVPPPDLKNPVDRGRYLAAAGECAGCHTAWYHRNPGLFGGGDEMYYNDEKKRGKVFSANISSHATGVGTWPVEVFIEVMRTGKSGTLDAAMPWQAFKNLNDEDLTAMLAFLKISAPVEHLLSNNEPPTWCEVCEQKHGLGEANKVKSLRPFDPDYVIPWDIAGEYSSPDGGLNLSISKLNAQWRLFATIRGTRRAGVIVPLSKTEFAADGYPFQFSFELDPNGKVSALKILEPSPVRFHKKK